MKTGMWVAAVGLCFSLNGTFAQDGPNPIHAFDSKKPHAIELKESQIPAGVTLRPAKEKYWNHLPTGLHDIQHVRLRIQVVDQSGRVEYTSWTSPFNLMSQSPEVADFDFGHLARSLKPGYKIVVDGASHDLHRNNCKTARKRKQKSEYDGFKDCDDVPWTSFPYYAGELELRLPPSASGSGSGSGGAPAPTEGAPKAGSAVEKK